jgi:hypothetical protein
VKRLGKLNIALVVIILTGSIVVALLFLSGNLPSSDCVALIASFDGALVGGVVGGVAVGNYMAVQ